MNTVCFHPTPMKKMQGSPSQYRHCKEICYLESVYANFANCTV